MKPYRDFFKRAIDIVASGGALLVLAVPLAAVTAWLHLQIRELVPYFINYLSESNSFKENPYQRHILISNFLSL